MQIKIYSTTTCPYCKMLKAYLDGKGIVYEEKLVDQSEEAKQEMMTKSKGYLGVPYMIITRDNGEEVSVIGFDKKKVSSLLD